MNKSSSKVIVRFAPSPTGHLHLGGARTAVFNWLYARHNRGKFLLRIEDTDRERSDQAMVDAIFEGLQWLGVQWDEDPVYQSERIEYYREIVLKLVEKDKAYRCYCSQQRLEGLKSNYRYDGRCRKLSMEEKEALEASGAPSVVRFKVVSGKTTFLDSVHGSLTFDNDEIEDFVLLRSDGMPTYHLAVVADDKDMGVTTVIRGDDHISNSPKQVMLYHALGWAVPEMAHVPLILGADKKRLSKRHGATSVNEYRDAGYSPEAVFNFLALLGWSPGDNRELLAVDELVQAFSLKGVSRSNAVFDEQKLLWLNGMFINEMADDEIVERIIPLLRENLLMSTDKPDLSYIGKVVALLKKKIRRLPDFINLGSYFFKDPEEFEQKAVDKYWSDSQSVSRNMEVLSDRIAEIDDFSADLLEQTLRMLAEKLEISAAKLIHPARLSLTGFSVSPGIFELMEVLGKETVVRRLLKAAKILKQRA